MSLWESRLGVIQRMYFALHNRVQMILVILNSFLLKVSDMSLMPYGPRRPGAEEPDLGWNRMEGPSERPNMIHLTSIIPDPMGL